MSEKIRNVHIGKAIARRLAELKISKSELGRRINIPQQHINRMLEKASIDTARLVAVCNAMDFNFFSLFSKSVQEEIHAYVQTVATDCAQVQNNIGKNKVKNGGSISKEDYERLNKRIVIQEKEIEKRDGEIRDLKEKVALLEAEIKSKEAQMSLHQVNIQSKDDNIAQLKSNIQTKDDIIALLKGQIDQLLKERRPEQ